MRSWKTWLSILTWHTIACTYAIANHGLETLTLSFCMCVFLCLCLPLSLSACLCVCLERIHKGRRTNFYNDFICQCFGHRPSSGLSPSSPWKSLMVCLSSSALSLSSAFLVCLSLSAILLGILRLMRQSSCIIFSLWDISCHFSIPRRRLLLANCMDRAPQNDIHAMNIDQVQANAAVSASCEFLQKISALVCVQQAPVHCSFV